MDQDISIVLPVFIREPSVRRTELLARAIDSVLSQDYPADFEVLVIDDGSGVPVEVQLRAERLRANPHVRWIRLPQNAGLVNALNTGLRAAKYELIGRIDSDDVWRVDKIAKQLQLLRTDRDLSIVGTGMVLVDGTSGSREDHLRPGDWPGILRFFIDVGCPFPHGSVVARRAVYSLLGGYSHDPRVAHAEDFALWGVWLRFFKPAMVEELLYEYHVSKESVSSLHRKQQKNASGHIQRSFRALQNWHVIPESLEGLADALRLSVLDAGVFCFLGWKYQLSLKVPRKAVAHLRALLPDRKIVISTHGQSSSQLSSLRAGDFSWTVEAVEDPVGIEIVPSFLASGDPEEGLRWGGDPKT